MKIWSLSKAEEEAIIFFQAADAQNKTVCQWTQNYFIVFDKALLELYEKGRSETSWFVCQYVV